MTLIINNMAATNVILSIGRTDYLIKSNDHGVSLCVPNGVYSLKVKRQNEIPAPPYKKLLLAELLGVFSLIFSKPAYYIFDVSSTYQLDTNKECVTVTIKRSECGSIDVGTYDVIIAESANFPFKATSHCVENRKEITSVFDKCKKVGRLWLYIIMDLLFALAGSVILCPLLLGLYFTTEAALFMVLTIFVPIFLIGFFSLILVLPLHFILKISDKNFYRSMESDEISSRLSEEKHTK